MLGANSGAATMVGGAGNELFVGLGGTADARGSTGNDTFFCGSGPMTITEGSGLENVVFAHGNATVTGGTSKDLYTLISLTDGTQITIVGVSQLAPNTIISA